jgi:putative ABC transport system permease protein
MVKRSLNRKILRELRQLRAQAVTIALLIICGLSLMISTRISYDSLHHARDDFYRDFHFADIFAEFQAAPRSITERLRDIPGLRLLEPRLMTEGLIEVEGQAEPAVGRMLSVPPEQTTRLNQIFVREGRLPRESQNPEVFLHEAFAQAHRLQMGDSIVALIKGQRVRLQIVGVGLSPEYVYALHSALPLPDDKHFAVLWLSEAELGRLMRLQDSVNSITATTDGSRSMDLIKQDLGLILEPYGNKVVADRRRIPSHMFLEDELTEQQTLSIVSPLLFLGIAIFLIHMIMSRLIHTHRPQIATLKAVGYHDREIAWHYAKLILAMMMFGTLPALAIGIWLGQLIVDLYQQFFRFPELKAVVNPGILLLALVIGLGSGLLGGMTAIRSILRLPPVEALKPPVPPVYHAIFLDRPGLKKRWPVTTRMTWRNLMLRPLRLTLTIMGMAAALGIMISSGSLKDMVNFLLKAQFQHIQREDISLTLQRPVSVDAIQELMGIPGVLRVESFRTAGVRIHREHRQKETALFGWPASSELRQRVNAKLEPIPLPPQGLFLSRYFQTDWQLKPGDRVELEILEGSFPRHEMRVAGFSDDLVGTAAHVRMDEIWQLLKEKPAYNMLCLKVDPRWLNAVYYRLNQYPLVATISLRMAFYRGFHESMGGLLQFSTTLLLVFAFIIAIGLIYNIVVMTFSERAREMATLQVLGFDVNFLFLLLLDGVIIPLVLCLIPGMLLGYKLTSWLTGSMRTDTLSLPIVLRWPTYAIGLATMLLALIFSAWSLYRLMRSLSLTEALKARE